VSYGGMRGVVLRDFLGSSFRQRYPHLA
jgi:hypothetical protein